MSLIKDFNKGVDKGFRGEPVDYTKSMAQIQGHEEGVQRAQEMSRTTYTGGGVFLLIAIGALYMLFHGTNPTPDSPPSPIDAHVVGMPSPKQILSAFREPNNAESDARQYAACWAMVQSLDNLSAGRVFRNELTSREQALKAAYLSVMRDIEQRHVNDREFQLRYLSMANRREFRVDTLSRLTSAKWQAQYLKQAVP